MNYTYILKCKDETLYTGWTNDIEKRLEAHNAGKGAKYTRSRRPVELVYLEQFETKEEAMRREYAIKHMLYPSVLLFSPVPHWQIHKGFPVPRVSLLAL